MHKHETIKLNLYLVLLQGVRCGYCGPLDTFSERYPPMTRFTTGSDVELSALIGGIRGGSVDVSLCVRDDDSKNENEACFQDIPLYSSDVAPSTDLMTSLKQISTRVSLPPGVTCQHCILRWRRTEGKEHIKYTILTLFNSKTCRKHDQFIKFLILLYFVHS